MHSSHIILRLLDALAHSGMIPLASASYQDAIRTVGGIIGGDPKNIGELYSRTMVAFLVIVNVVGMIMIVKAGVFLALKQGEDQMGSAKKTIGATAIALVIINLAPQLTSALLTMGSGGGTIISNELIGIAGFIDTIAGAAAIVAIIVSGIRAVTSYGSEDGTTHIKRTVIAVFSGIIIIGAKVAIERSVVSSHSPGELTTVIVKIINIVLGIAGLLAVTAVIYAGLLMIVNFGKEEQYSRAKGLVIRVGIGLVVILSSLAIVNLVIAK